MALSSLVRINGDTLSGLGVLAVSPSPPMDYAGQERATYGVPGRLGRIPATVAVGREKELPLRLALGTTTIETRQSTLDSLLSKLQGLLEIELGYATDRVYWGYVDQVALRARYESLAFIEGDTVLDLPIMVPSGSAVARDATVLHIGTSPTDIVGLGVLPSAPLIVIPGTVTDPVIDYQDPAQVTITKLTIDGVVAAGEYLEIDCATQRITLVNESTGTRTLKMSYFDHTVSGNAFPVFDPGDGSGGRPPLVKCSVAATAYYAARYP